MSKWRRLQQRIPSFKNTMSESYLCVDCGFDTMPGNLYRAEAEQDAAAQVAAASIAGVRPISSATTYGRPPAWSRGAAVCV
jgi:hypothetical protein